MRIWLVDMGVLYSLLGSQESRTHFRLAGMADNGVAYRQNRFFGLCRISLD
jgi:hypothetical protein